MELYWVDGNDFLANRKVMVVVGGEESKAITDSQSTLEPLRTQSLAHCYFSAISVTFLVQYNQQLSYLQMTAFCVAPLEMPMSA